MLENDYFRRGLRKSLIKPVQNRDRQKSENREEHNFITCSMKCKIKERPLFCVRTGEAGFEKERSCQIVAERSCGWSVYVVITVKDSCGPSLEAGDTSVCL